MKQTAAPLKSEATRAKILGCALALFRKRGFDRTTMRDVADSAGVALGGAYYYFPSKHALVLAYYQETQAAHSTRARATMRSARGLRERVGAVFHTKLDVLQKDRKLLGAIFRSVGDPADPLSLFGSQAADVRNESIALFDQALEGSDITPEMRPLVTMALWGLHMGVLLYFLHDTSTKQARTRRLVDGGLDQVVALLSLAPMLGPLTHPLTALLEEAQLLPVPGKNKPLPSTPALLAEPLSAKWNGVVSAGTARKRTPVR